MWTILSLFTSSSFKEREKEKEQLYCCTKRTLCESLKKKQKAEKISILYNVHNNYNNQ